MKGLGQRLGLVEGDDGIPDEFRVYRREPGPEVEHAWAVTEALLRRLAARVREVGSQFVVFHVPFRPSVYDDESQRMKKQWDLSESDRDLSTVGRRLDRIARDSRFSLVDRTDQFRWKAAQAERGRRRLYFRVDGHRTAPGHELVAELLAQHLLADL